MHYGGRHAAIGARAATSLRLRSVSVLADWFSPTWFCIASVYDQACDRGRPIDYDVSMLWRRTAAYIQSSVAQERQMGPVTAAAAAAAAAAAVGRLLP